MAETCPRSHRRFLWSQGRGLFAKSLARHGLDSRRPREGAHGSSYLAGRMILGFQSEPLAEVEMLIKIYMYV